MLPCDLISSSSIKLSVACALIFCTVHTAPRTAKYEVTTTTTFAPHGRDLARRSKTHTRTLFHTLLRVLSQFVTVAGRLLTVPHVPSSPANCTVKHLRIATHLRNTAKLPLPFTIQQRQLISFGCSVRQRDYPSFSPTALMRIHLRELDPSDSQERPARTGRWRFP